MAKVDREYAAVSMVAGEEELRFRHFFCLDSVLAFAAASFAEIFASRELLACKSTLLGITSEGRGVKIDRNQTCEGRKERQSESKIDHEEI